MNTEQERADFEAWLRVKPCGAAHDFAWEAWQARAAIEADRKRRGEPVAWPADILLAAEMALEDAEDDESPTIEIHASRIVESLSPPQPTDPSGAPTLHNTDSGAQNAIQATQPAEPVKEQP